MNKKEIKTKTRMIDGHKFTTKCGYVYSANVLEVEAGTNGYKGGDSGHGSRTYFRIKDAASTDIRPSVLGSSFEPDGFEVRMGGDCELHTIIKALRFIADTLEEQSGEKVETYYEYENYDDNEEYEIGVTYDE